MTSCRQQCRYLTRDSRADTLFFNQGASKLAKEAVDLVEFDNALEAVMSRADAVFFILHDIEIRVNPNLEEYKKQLAAAYKNQGTQFYL